MAGPILAVPISAGVRVADELLRAEQPLAFETLDAPRCRRRVRFRQDDSSARTEAKMLHPEREGRRLRVEAAQRCQRWRSVEQDAAQAFGVTLSDEPALRRGHRDDLGQL